MNILIPKNDDIGKSWIRDQILKIFQDQKMLTNIYQTTFGNKLKRKFPKLYNYLYDTDQETFSFMKDIILRIVLQDDKLLGFENYLTIRYEDIKVISPEIENNFIKRTQFDSIHEWKIFCSKDFENNIKNEKNESMGYIFSIFMKRITIYIYLLSKFNDMKNIKRNEIIDISNNILRSIQMIFNKIILANKKLKAEKPNYRKWIVIIIVAILVLYILPLTIIYITGCIVALVLYLLYNREINMTNLILSTLSSWVYLFLLKRKDIVKKKLLL
jgi:hypothetical protein